MIGFYTRSSIELEHSENTTLSINSGLDGIELVLNDKVHFLSPDDVVNLKLMLDQAIKHQKVLKEGVDG